MVYFLSSHQCEVLLNLLLVLLFAMDMVFKRLFCMQHPIFLLKLLRLFGKQTTVNPNSCWYLLHRVAEIWNQYHLFHFYSATPIVKLQTTHTIDKCKKCDPIHHTHNSRFLLTKDVLQKNYICIFTNTRFVMLLWGQKGME